MKKIVFLTGAGISAESGIPTFRGAIDGLWENHNVERVIKELQSNGYKVTLYPSGITSEYILIEW